MAKRNYGIDYIILGLIFFHILAYDFHTYNQANTIFLQNCDQVIEIALWGDECVQLKDKLDTLVIEMVVLGILGIASIIHGRHKMNEPNWDVYGEEKSSGIHWKWIIPIPFIFIILVFVDAAISEFLL